MWNIFLLRLTIASTYLIAKASFDVVQPLFFIGTFSGVAGLILLAWCRRYQAWYPLRRDDFLILLQVALYQIYLPYSIDFHAARHVSSNIWALIHAACPFVTALFAWVAFKEVLNSRKLFGLLVGLFGFATIFIWDNSAFGHSSSILPELALTISMIIYAYSWILTKKLAYRYHPLFINGVAMSFGGLLAFISSACIESWPVISTGSISTYAVLSALGVITIIGSFPLYAHLLKQYSTTFLAFSSLLEPIFVALFGWIIFAEAISLHFICALIILTSGLYIFYREELGTAQTILAEES